jgi:hypothetical protein
MLEHSRRHHNWQPAPGSLGAQLGLTLVNSRLLRYYQACLPGFELERRFNTNYTENQKSYAP